MPALLLIFAFIVVPLAELAVIIQVGQAIGVVPTIAILLADSILGGFLLRSQGRATWRRFNETMRSGRIPHREALDGALVIFGGALLLTPGFITDVVGLLVLFPPTRAAARRIVAGVVARRLYLGVFGIGRFRRDGRTATGRAGSADAPAHRPYDVEGTATDLDGSPGDASRSRLDR